MGESERVHRSHPNNDENWYTSSFTSGGCSCVEAHNNTDGSISIRDSKVSRISEDWEQITVDAETRPQLLAAVALGIEGAIGGGISIDRDGVDTVSCETSGVNLTYTPQEFAAWGMGIRAGEFDVPTTRLGSQTSLDSGVPE